MLKGYGQLIRDDGPTTHHTKRGTPTMGGTVIIVAIAARLSGRAPGLPARRHRVGPARALLDDGPRLRRVHRRLHQDPQAAQPRPDQDAAKFAGQAVVAIVFGVLATHFRNVARPRAGVDPPLVHPRLRARLHRGRIRRLGLPDGHRHLERREPHRRPRRARRRRVLHGLRRLRRSLRSGSTATTASPTSREHHCYAVRDPLDIAIIAAAAMGACFGFLWWNASPAGIFMGDTGSLALGGLLAGIAIDDPHRAAARRARRPVRHRDAVGDHPGRGVPRRPERRVFNMAPFHHHFELAGWDENTVIVRFWIIAGLAVAFGLGVFYAAFLSTDMTRELRRSARRGGRSRGDRDRSRPACSSTGAPWSPSCRTVTVSRNGWLPPSCGPVARRCGSVTRHAAARRSRRRLTRVPARPAAGRGRRCRRGRRHRRARAGLAVAPAGRGTLARHHRHQRQDDDRRHARVDPAGRRPACRRRRQRRPSAGFRRDRGPRVRRAGSRDVERPAAVVPVAALRGRRHPQHRRGPSRLARHLRGVCRRQAADLDGRGGRGQPRRPGCPRPAACRGSGVLRHLAQGGLHRRRWGARRDRDRRTAAPGRGPRRRRPAQSVERPGGRGGRPRSRRPGRGRPLRVGRLPAGSSSPGAGSEPGRGRLGRRLQGDQPARRRGQSRGVPVRGLDRRWPAEGRRRRVRSSPSTATGCAQSSCSAGTAA